MRRFKSTGAVALIALCGLSPAIAQVSDMNEDIPFQGALEGFGEQYSTYIPKLGDREFDMARVGAESNFKLGCSGIPQYGAVANVGAEVERVFDYLQQNALGLAVNYLVYRNPTLYSFLQNLNQKHSFLTQQMMASCSSVRENATDQREGAQQAQYETQAMDTCLASGKTAEFCSLGSNIESDARQAQQLRQQKRDQQAGMSGATPTDLVLERMGTRSRQAKVVTGESFEKVIRDVTGDELLGSGAGGGSGGGSGSGGADNSAGDSSGGSGTSELGTSIDPPEAQVEEKIIEMTQEFATDYQSIVASARDQSLLQNEAYRKLSQLPAIPTLSGKAVMDLYEASQETPLQYAQVIGAMARESAIVSMRHVLDKYEIALLDARTTTTGALNDAEWDRRMNELKLLRAQVDMVDNKARYQEHVLQIVEDARRSF
ncbi:hypothetical protein J7355_16700 [Endozoicomonas sp. G2_2]|uniref:hypothetical protein n=1 Tax=Endozoicomonas sp. G2_2 TaxID=2821092 RepID=UPI001AD96E38|nr:hypothetical protein [Endozoicomonas sp. G2_2]MBO9471732.1 hypothetical protein [Endozoicomonas sp. G2_2]